MAKGLLHYKKKLKHFCRKICDVTPEGLRSLGKFEYFCMITKIPLYE